MNPFTAFLQPVSRTIQGAPSLSDIESMAAGRRQEKQRALENEQQNTRANAAMKMQQDYQSRKFSKEDQAEVEGLLSEYQVAEDQGDQVTLSRVAQKLKRFGMDVSPGGGERSPEAKGLPTQLLPSLRDFTGQQGSKPNLQEFTGQNGAPGEPELSQDDFEAQLIADTANPPARYEQGGQTTDEFKGQIQQVDDLGDVDSPEFQQAAKAETAEPVDMGDVDSPEFQAAGKAETGERSPLATGLPTQTLRPRGAVISKGGKALYESSGPSGRWEPMVTSVFEPFTNHQTPEIALAANRAKELASKLIGVDGIAPKDAIEFAFKQLNDEANRATNLERTRLGSKPRGAGGVGGFKAMGRGQDSAESIKTYITEGRGQIAKLNDSDRLLAQAEALANSSDPALQRNAIDILVQSRSGATVSDRERARYDQLDGVLSQAQNYVARWNGGALSPDYVNKVKMVIATQRSINATTREEIATDLEEAYAAQNEGKVEQPILERRKAALGKTIRRSGGPESADPNADLYE